MLRAEAFYGCCEKLGSDSGKLLTGDRVVNKKGHAVHILLERKS